MQNNRLSRIFPIAYIIYAEYTLQRVLLHRLEQRHHVQVSVWSAWLHQFKPTSCAGGGIFTCWPRNFYSLLTLYFFFLRIGWTIFYQKVFKSVRDQVWYKFFLKMCNFKGWRGWRGQSFPPSVCLSILSKVSLCIRIKTKQIHHTPLSGVTLN